MQLNPDLLIYIEVCLTLPFSYCNEHDTIYAILSDFGDRMTTQSMGLMVLFSECF